MHFAPIAIQDKTGRTIVLRSAGPEDAEDLIRCLKTVFSESPYLLRGPEEVATTPEQEAAFLKQTLEDPQSLMLLALLDGKLVGSGSFHPVGSCRRLAHRCEVGAALYQVHCGCGIGTIMLQTLLHAAKEQGFEQAELEVASGNTAAIALYQKLGFQKYGTLPDYLKYASGQYASMDWMMKKL